MSDKVNKNMLFYSFDDYQKGMETINRIKKYFLTDYALVGGFANRFLFPDYFAGLPVTRLNDLDFCILPKGDEPTLRSNITEEFYIVYINPSNGSYYFMLIDKENFIKVDIFINPRPTEKGMMKVDGLTVPVLPEEEIFLKIARDVYGHLSQDRPLESKHVRFYQYLRNNINLTKIDLVWLEEKKVIYKINQVDFIGWVDYLKVVDDLVNQKSDLLFVKQSQLPKYPVESAIYHPFGFSMVDQAAFDQIFTERQRRFFY